MCTREWSMSYIRSGGRQLDERGFTCALFNERRCRARLNRYRYYIAIVTNHETLAGHFWFTLRIICGDLYFFFSGQHHLVPCNDVPPNGLLLPLMAIPQHSTCSGFDLGDATAAPRAAQMPSIGLLRAVHLHQWALGVV